MSLLVAKATTITNGIEAAIQIGFTNINIEGDNKILIQAVQIIFKRHGRSKF